MAKQTKKKAAKRELIKPKGDSRYVRRERFEKLKEAELERGREEETATDVAAREVKELRRREGRSKDDSPPNPR